MNIHNKTERSVRRDRLLSFLVFNLAYTGTDYDLLKTALVYRWLVFTFCVQLDSECRKKCLSYHRQKRVNVFILLELVTVIDFKSTRNSAVNLQKFEVNPKILAAFEKSEVNEHVPILTD